MACAAGCVNGPSSNAQARALEQVTVAAKKLAASTQSVNMTASSTRASGLFDHLNYAVLTFTGTPPSDIAVITATTTKTTAKRNDKSEDVTNSTEVVLGRIPVARPQSFLSILFGAKHAVEFGGVQVNGKAATRYDVRIAVATLNASDDAAAQFLGHVYGPGAKEFQAQVDIAKNGEVLRVQFPSNMAAETLEATAEGGAFNAVSVDLTPLGASTKS